MVPLARPRQYRGLASAAAAERVCRTIDFFVISSVVNQHLISNPVFQRQRRAVIPAWGTAPGQELCAPTILRFPQSRYARLHELHLGLPERRVTSVYPFASACTSFWVPPVSPLRRVLFGCDSGIVSSHSTTRSGPSRFPSTSQRKLDQRHCYADFTRRRLTGFPGQYSAFSIALGIDPDIQIVTAVLLPDFISVLHAVFFKQRRAGASEMHDHLSREGELRTLFEGGQIIIFDAGFEQQMNVFGHEHIRP